ncbi:MAG: hypothetical protein ACRYE9_00155 [Janthinobacterium lividum]
MATYTELFKILSFKDLMKINALLDMRADVERRAYRELNKK